MVQPALSAVLAAHDPDQRGPAAVEPLLPRTGTPRGVTSGDRPVADQG